MPDWLLPVVVLDLLITAAVVLWVVRHQGPAATGGAEPASARRAILDFRGIAEFAKEKHERIGEYVHANWSGVPAQLPGVLQPLLDELEREASSRGLPLDRDILKTLVAHSLKAHRIGRGSDVQGAIDRVA